MGKKLMMLTKMFKSKDKIKVKASSNKTDGRLQFSIKRLSVDPWEKIEEQISKEKK